jgi:hypothetical protein
MEVSSMPGKVNKWDGNDREIDGSWGELTLLHDIVAWIDTELVELLFQRFYRHHFYRF